MDVRKMFMGIVAFLFMYAIVFKSSVYAETFQFEGSGECFYVIDSMTLQEAKDFAKTEAIRDVSRQAYFHVKSKSVMKDYTSEFDEINSYTESIMRIQSTKYNILPKKKDYIVRSMIIAEIDIDELEELLDS